MQEVIILLALAFAACTIYIVQYKRSSNIVQTMNNKTPETVESKMINNTRALKTFKGNVKYHLTMGLHKNNKDSWLIVDENYPLEHDLRLDVLRNKENRVVACLPLAEDACKEAMSLVVDYLMNNYKEVFSRSNNDKGDFAKILSTGETFRISPPHDDLSPLEIAARLAVEDLNVLMKQANGEHFLAATASFFPAGWDIEERIGWPLGKIHGPVPLWQEKLHSPVEHFLSRLQPGNSTERSAYFIQVMDPQESMAMTLHRPKPFDFDVEPPGPEFILIRRERQTFTQLPRTGAVLFAVRTSWQTLVELDITELRALSVEMEGWPDEIAMYKGRHCWGPFVTKYLEQAEKVHANPTA